jgi:deoxyribose-phosphate aldolase
MRRHELAALINYTATGPAFTNEDIRARLDRAIAAGCGTFTVSSSSVKFASLLGRGEEITIGALTGGFPHGRLPIPVKALDAREAVRRGADSLAVQVNIGGFKECSPDYLDKEVKDAVAAADGRPVSAVLESGYLNDDQMVKAALIAVEAGAGWIQIGTGYGPTNPTPADVSNLRSALPETVRIAVSGGIQSVEQADALVSAGAERLGVDDAENLLERAEN